VLYYKHNSKGQFGPNTNSFTGGLAMSSKTKVVGSLSDWSGRLKDFWRKVDDGTITLERFDTFLEDPGKFDVETYQHMILGWQKFWQAQGIEADFSNLQIPKKKAGFDRLLIIPQGMTPQKAYELCANEFKCWKYTGKSLDNVIQHEDRTAKDGAYTVWVRDRVEADEELKNLSANDLAKKKLNGITLTERLAYELKYYSETGQHLDITKYTLCSGSQYTDGFVPSVCWRDGGVRVFWYLLDPRFEYLRARQAVS